MKRKRALNESQEDCQNALAALVCALSSAHLAQEATTQKICAAHAKRARHAAADAVRMLDVATGVETTPDHVALEHVRDILSEPEWDSETAERIARVLVANGRAPEDA